MPMGLIVTGSAIALTAIAMVTSSGIAQQAQLRVEVAENGTRYVFDRQQHVDDQDLALRGNTFLAEGYVYPVGTLTCEGGICNGVLLDEAGVGTAEFPDAVIGTWTCYGMHVEDVSRIQSGPITVTTQIFDLGETAGSATVVTTGFELIDFETNVSRAVTGGTGAYASASGEQRQRVIGLNNPGVKFDGVTIAGVTYAVEFDLPAI
jgi:hypothetical protein